MIYIPGLDPFLKCNKNIKMPSIPQLHKDLDQISNALIAKKNSNTMELENKTPKDSISYCSNKSTIAGDKKKASTKVSSSQVNRKLIFAKNKEENNTPKFESTYSKNNKDINLDLIHDFNQLAASFGINDPQILEKFSIDTRVINDPKNEKLLHDLDSKIEEKNRFRATGNQQIFEEILRGSWSGNKKKNFGYDVDLNELVLPGNKNFEKILRQHKQKSQIEDSLSNFSKNEGEKDKDQLSIQELWDNNHHINLEKENSVLHSVYLDQKPYTPASLNSRPKTAPKGIGRTLSTKRPGKPLTNFLDMSVKQIINNSNQDCTLNSNKDSFDISVSESRKLGENNNKYNINANTSVLNSFQSYSSRKFKSNSKVKIQRQVLAYNQLEEMNSIVSQASSIEKHEYKIAALRKAADDMKTELYNDIDVTKNQILENLNPRISYVNNTFRPNT